MEIFAGLCKFRDCMHLKEPGCAIKNAVRDGEIAPERYLSYLRILGKVSPLFNLRMLVEELYMESLEY
jgi:ribosome biogenesis GTPase / thiamine phosphate phosphatase